MEIDFFSLNNNTGNSGYIHQITEMKLLREWTKGTFFFSLQNNLFISPGVQSSYNALPDP